MSQIISLNYIGKVSSPYKEKFAIPRQPGLVTAAKGSIALINDANSPELVRGLEAFSHIWVIFVFHGTQEQGWKPLVRPPRLGGNTKVGALATRSTFRPNPIGMSVVKLDSIETIDNSRHGKSTKEVILNISGLDLLDGTPILDIKPYIPYSDALINAQAGYAQEPPEHNVTVTFNDSAKLALQKLSEQKVNAESSEKVYPELELFIIQILEQDPRPAYKQNKRDDKVYGMLIHNLNVLWQFNSLTQITVTAIDVTIES